MLFMVVNEVDREGVVKVMFKVGDIVEVYIVKKLHIFENYFNCFRLIIICKTVIFATEYTEKALIYKLWAQLIWSFVKRMIKLLLSRDQKDSFYNRLIVIFFDNLFHHIWVCKPDIWSVIFINIKDIYWGGKTYPSFKCLFYFDVSGSVIRTSIFYLLHESFVGVRSDNIESSYLTTTWVISAILIS